MIILYIIGILCSLLLFAPNIIPFFVKWPVALVGVLLIVFFFNLIKKDTIYTTHKNKKRLYDFGLYNPLIMYISASSYILGFNMIFTFLAEKEVSDIVSNISTIPSLLTFDLSNKLFIGLIFVVAGILFYLLRNAFRNGASKSSLKTRTFWYVILTLLALGCGIYSFMNFQTFDVYEHLRIGNNMYIYFGIAGLFVLVDLVCLIIGCAKRRNRKKLEAEIIAAGGQNGCEPITRKQIKENKKSKIAAKERLRLEKKLAKKEAKINKKLAKIEARKAKKIKKAERKLAKLNN